LQKSHKTIIKIIYIQTSHKQIRRVYHSDKIKGVEAKGNKNEIRRRKAPSLSSSSLFIAHLAGLEIVTWDQPNLAISVVDFCFPPSIILVTIDGKIVAFSEAEFLRDSSLIHIYCARCCIC
jgi:hypothetical protein